MPMTTFDEYFGPARTMCTAAGIWPLEKDASPARRMLHWVAKILTMLGNLNFIFPAMLKISEEREDFATVMRVSATITVTLLLGVKQLYFTVRSAELGRVYSELKDLHVEVVEVDGFPEERNIYDDYARKCRKLTVVFFASVMSNNLLGTIVSVINSWLFGLDLSLPYELAYALRFHPLICLLKNFFFSHWGEHGRSDWNGVNANTQFLIATQRSLKDIRRSFLGAYFGVSPREFRHSRLTPCSPVCSALIDADRGQFSLVL